MADYKIEDVEGIGSVYGEKLRKAGIKSVDQLLKVGCKPTGRKELAEAGKNAYSTQSDGTL